MIVFRLVDRPYKCFVVIVVVVEVIIRTDKVDVIKRLDIYHVIVFASLETK